MMAPSSIPAISSPSEASNSSAPAIVPLTELGATPTTSAASAIPIKRHSIIQKQPTSNSSNANAGSAQHTGSGINNPGAQERNPMFTIFLSVLFYWVVSITMVFVNKTLLSDPAGQLDAPFLITWFQCVVTVIGCYVLGALNVANVPKFELQRTVVFQMLPLSCVFTLMIICNNLSLKYVEISFYQVARSLTIIFNVTFDYIILGHRTSPAAMVCCMLVVAGFVVGNHQELRWSLPGVIFGVSASFFVAMNAIYVKKKFPLVDNNPWRLTLYNNVNACFLFIPLILVFDKPSHIMASPNITSLNFWALMTAGGAFGICVSFAVAAQIKYTSPLTHNVSATAKAAFQTVLGLLVYKNPITIWGGLSVAVILLGSLCYTLVRRAELMKTIAAHQSTTQTHSQAKSPQQYVPKSSLPDDRKPLLSQLPLPTRSSKNPIVILKQ